MHPWCSGGRQGSVEGMGDDIEPFMRPEGGRSLAEIKYHGQLQEKLWEALKWGAGCVNYF